MPRLNTLAACLSVVAIAPLSVLATYAPVVSDNPQGAQYIARIDRPGLHAEVVAETPLDGVGAQYTVNINGNSSLSGSNFMYHVHVLPVAEDGNCSSTKTHLDPYGRGENPPCDKSDPSNCEVGDLSGKYGVIPSLPGFSANYTDKYSSLTPGSPAFIGNRSIVLHYPNKTRIACANFKYVEKNTDTSTYIGDGRHTSHGGYGSTSTLGGYPTVSVTTSRPSASGTVVAPFTGDAEVVLAGKNSVMGALVFGLAAALW